MTSPVVCAGCGDPAELEVRPGRGCTSRTPWPACQGCATAAGLALAALDRDVTIAPLAPPGRPR